MKTILVVDDFASVRFYHENLLKQGGYQTIPARDGVEALAALEQNRVDLIMLDLHMPTMSGREFLAHVRSRPQFASIPVLLVTSDSQPEYADALVGGKTCGVLRKPILPQTLIKEVAGLLSATTAPHQTTP